LDHNNLEYHETLHSNDYSQPVSTDTSPSGENTPE